MTMKSIQDKLINTQFEHALWFNELDFAFKEIKIYEDRILELIEAYTGKLEESELGEVLLEFLAQKEAAEQIKDHIKEHLLSMAEKIHSNGELNAIVNTSHHKTKEDIALFRKEYGQLKEKIHRLPAFKD